MGLIIYRLYMCINREWIKTLTFSTALWIGANPSASTAAPAAEEFVPNHQRHQSALRLDFIANVPRWQL